MPERLETEDNYLTLPGRSDDRDKVIIGEITHLPASELAVELVRRYNAHAALVSAAELTLHQLTTDSDLDNVTASDGYRRLAELLRSALSSANRGAR